MKKVFLLSLMALLVSTSCSKSDNNTSSTPSGNTPTTPAPTKTELITDKNWVLTAITVNGKDNLHTWRACQLDNIHRFNSDITYVLDEGPTKCNPSDPQIITQFTTWEFLENETKIKFRGTIQKVVELTSTKLVLEFDSGSLISVSTYTAQ